MFKEEEPFDWEAEASKANAHVAEATKDANQRETLQAIKRFGKEASNMLRADAKPTPKLKSLISHTCAQSAWMLLYMPNLTQLHVTHYINLAKGFADPNTLAWAHLRFVESKAGVHYRCDLEDAYRAAQEAYALFEICFTGDVTKEVLIQALVQCALAALELNRHEDASTHLEHVWKILHPPLGRPRFQPSPSDVSDIHDLIGKQENVYELNFLALAERYNRLKRFGNTYSCLNEIMRYTTPSSYPMSLARRKVLQGEMLLDTMQYSAAKTSFEHASNALKRQGIIHTSLYVRVLLGLTEIEFIEGLTLTYTEELTMRLDALNFEATHCFRRQLENILYKAAERDKAAKRDKAAEMYISDPDSDYELSDDESLDGVYITP